MTYKQVGIVLGGLFATAALIVASVAFLLPPEIEQVTLEWQPDLNIEHVVEFDFPSSTQLFVEWNEHLEYEWYILTVTDGVTGEVEQLTVFEDEIVLAGLKSSTEYRVELRACMDDICQRGEDGGETSAMTSEEYWQLIGDGGSGYTSVTEVVEDGSTLSYVMPVGEYVEDLEGIVRMYYNAQPQPGQEDSGGIRYADSEDGGVSFGESTGLFLRECQTHPDPMAAGLEADTECPETQLEMLAFQIVPMYYSLGTRIFFEAFSPADADHVMQIYQLNSQDGWLGVDFDQKMDSSICGDSSERELITGGTCEPELLISSSQISALHDGLSNARQHKIGYPIQDSGWLWDEEPGTFMVITGSDECEQTRDGLFYANWTPFVWEVVQEEDCAKPLVMNAHGPVIVHLGESRYKLYYENYLYADEMKGRFISKPFRVIYGNGELDDTSGVSYDDWESEEDAREVTFLWPDGTILSAAEEAGLGDHMIWVKDGDLQMQWMYMNLGGFDNADWGRGSAGIGRAVLLNP